MHLYLDYSEILGLSLLSKQFAGEGVENYLPWSVRHRAVAQAESRLPLKLNDKRACYLCFRIKENKDFQEADTMASHERVVQRDVFTGQRIFDVTLGPSPGQYTGIIQPPWVPVSPVSPISMGLGMGANANMYGAAMESASGFSIGDGVSGDGLAAIANMGTPVSAVVSPPTLRRIYHQWRPQAPGAEAGQIESLRSYCVECALDTRLASAGDLIKLRSGPQLWVCACQIARSRDNTERCRGCNMAPVYRTAKKR
ncbi:hypothetical protein SEUCBS139899_009347 [Sporothrix eucalyptigena]|uniref:Uncharacterized protein n=1 Tax=Sporothrix eucalyptigena TaxID=1812306 RepID=A0ABP0AUC3_9PEZI